MYLIVFACALDAWESLRSPSRSSFGVGQLGEAGGDWPRSRAALNVEEVGWEWRMAWGRVLASTFPASAQPCRLQSCLHNLTHTLLRRRLLIPITVKHIQTHSYICIYIYLLSIHFLSKETYNWCTTDTQIYSWNAVIAWIHCLCVAWDLFVWGHTLL